MIPPLTSWFLGLDLGQRHDHTALATLSLDWTIQGRDPVDWHWIRVPRLVLRDIERFPLGTGYPFYIEALAERSKQIQALMPAMTRAKIHLTVDAGGPGAPVVDEFRRARLQLDLKPLSITGGFEPGATSGGTITVPRRVLLSNLLLLVDYGKLVVPPELPNWPILHDELLALNAATWHPEKTTAHDDMVVALALSVWRASRLHRELMPECKAARPNWTPKGYLF